MAVRHAAERATLPGGRVAWPPGRRPCLEQKWGFSSRRTPNRRCWQLGAPLWVPQLPLEEVGRGVLWITLNRSAATAVQSEEVSAVACRIQRKGFLGHPKPCGEKRFLVHLKPFGESKNKKSEAGGRERWRLPRFEQSGCGELEGALGLAGAKSARLEIGPEASNATSSVALT